jgi:hypothetical protein
MIEDDGRPLIVGTARGLGVRDGEIVPDEEGVVEPESGGMSVAMETPENLVKHRRPPEAPKGHAFIEPVHPMALEEYELALAETRDAWRRLG